MKIDVPPTVRNGIMRGTKIVDPYDHRLDMEVEVDPAIFKFLCDSRSYGKPDLSVEVIESHMSLLFLIGDRVYKMKKPIRLDVLDNLELAQRLENCQQELMLNRALSPDIYLGVSPVTRDRQGKLQIDGDGEPVEWLVIMRRLDDNRLLDHAIPMGSVKAEHISELTNVLGSFYRKAEIIKMPDTDVITHWSLLMDRNEMSLRTQEFGLPADRFEAVLASSRSFLKKNSAILIDRARQGWIRDCHGDLRPEHVYLGPPVRLIDRLEFSSSLRWHDPFEEIVDLGLECERFGASWIFPLLVEGTATELGHELPPELIDFYAGVRGAVRARLAIEHLRHGYTDTEKWQQRTSDCLQIAARYACR